MEEESDERGTKEHPRSDVDIDIIPEDAVVNSKASPDTLVDFEIAFFTVILTIVLAYPRPSTAYQVLKFLLIIFAVLTVVRRILTMVEYGSDVTRFMTGSKELIIEISVLGITYVVFVFAAELGNFVQILDPLWVFFMGLIVIGSFPQIILWRFARNDLLLYQAVVASYQANTSPIKLWRDHNRKLAIVHANNIDLPDSDLPKEIVDLRGQKTHRILPFPNETAQFIHGLGLRIVRRSFGVMFGWAVFGSLSVSIALFIALTIVGGQVHFLFKRFGLESFHQRPNRGARLVVQNLGVFFAHFLISPLY